MLCNLTLQLSIVLYLQATTMKASVWKVINILKQHGSITSIHGISQINDISRPKKARLVWFMVLVGSLTYAMILLNQSIKGKHYE